MDEILKTLNIEQRRGVEEEFGTLLVLAGAGSGKTRVLTTRIANLVINGINPFSILAVTFTNKAALEMKDRLSKFLGEDIAKKMWVGTFHGICGRILRYDIENYSTQENGSWDRNFVIYDDTDSSTIIKNAIKKLNLDDKVYQPKLVKTVISNAKNKMQNAYNFLSKAKDYKSEKIGEIFEEYEKQLILNNALDFDDLLLLGVKLLHTNEDIRQKYFNRFSHILVDEFQDTNQSQYALIKAIYTNGLNENELENRSLCAVGDIDQSIYSWRGADFKIILNFQNDFKNTKLIKLEQNYRSSEIILEAANYVILNNSQRIEKNLYSNLGRGEKIIRFEAQNESMEANYIANKILNMKNNSNYNDIAVLYRTNSQSRAIEEALISNGIPYKMVGGLKFYDRKEIKDIIAYLKLIYNTNDSQSLKRVINVPKRGIGATTIKKIQDISEKNYISMYEVIQNIEEYEEFNFGTQNKIKDFYYLIEKMVNFLNQYKHLSELISYVIEISGYLKELKEEDNIESQGRIENLQELINVASDFEPMDYDNILGEFLAQVALVSDLDEISDEDTQSVTLMTLHSAKGLEFENVFLSGLDDGIFPHSRSINNNFEMEEERRLMYVGITRAKSRLIITNAKSRQMWGEYHFYEPSRFLKEIPEHLIDFNQSEKVNADISHSTFKSAVNRIKSKNSFGSDFKAPKYNYNNGKINLTNTFGKNFVAPSKFKGLSSNINNNNKKNDEDKVRDIIANSKIKKMLEEKRKNEAIEKEKIEEKNITIFSLKIGDRVFHPQFGIGSILDIDKSSSSDIFIVDFGKFGQKAVDSTYSNLKKF